MAAISEAPTELRSTPPKLTPIHRPRRPRVCLAPHAVQRPMGPDQTIAPLLAALQANRAAGMQPYSTPGHKLGKGCDPDLVHLLGRRFLESDVWLNSHHAHRTLEEAEALAAATWGASRTVFLGEGSSCGNRAVLLSHLRPGERVLVGRDMHTSMLAALVLTGARPVYVMPRLHAEFNLPIGYEPADIDTLLRTETNLRLVALGSPTYGGVASPLAAIADLAHEYGVPLLVDEAWGPHFAFHEALPASALASGADAVVSSPHKMLGALSQGAMIHVQGERIDLRRLDQAVTMLKTTSPLLPVFASLDAARRQMALQGRALLERTLELAAAVRRQVKAIPGLAVIDAVTLGLDLARYDATKVLVDVRGLGITGYEAEAVLRSHYRIAPEMADAGSVLFLVTIGDTAGTIRHLVRGLAALACDHRKSSARTAWVEHACASVLEPGAQVLSPREAFMAHTRTVPIGAARGEVAAESVTPYPPGVPVLMPGEVIGAAKLEYLVSCLRSGVRITGATDPALATLRVVDVAATD